VLIFKSKVLFGTSVVIKDSIRFFTRLEERIVKK
jgi:hypothetical protein